MGAGWLWKGLVGRMSAEWQGFARPTRGRAEALADEVSFWRQWLETKGGEFPDEYRARFSPMMEVEDPALRVELAEIERDPIAILDVGAGPCSVVGQRFHGRPLALTAVDPLADEYERLLSQFGVAPPVRTQPGRGETLLELFGAEAFDAVYARNAIDHSADPVRTVEQMVAVVRPGGVVVLRHSRNEGTHCRYSQLHQWNFDCRDGRFVNMAPAPGDRRR